MLGGLAAKLEKAKCARVLAWERGREQGMRGRNAIRSPNQRCRLICRSGICVSWFNQLSGKCYATGYGARALKNGLGAQNLARALGLK